MITDRERKAWFRMEMGRAAMLTREGLRITKMGRQTMETNGAVPGGILAIMAAPAATIAGQHRIEARRLAREAGWLTAFYAPHSARLAEARRGCENCAHVFVCPTLDPCLTCMPKPDIDNWEPK